MATPKQGSLKHVFGPLIQNLRKFVKSSKKGEDSANLITGFIQFNHKAVYRFVLTGNVVDAFALHRSGLSSASTGYDICYGWQAT